MDKIKFALLISYIRGLTSSTLTEEEIRHIEYLTQSVGSGYNDKAIESQQKSLQILEIF